RPAGRRHHEEERRLPPMTIALTPELERLVQEELESGRYPSASDLIREALLLLKERDQLRQYRLEELRREIAVGLDEAARGELAPVDIEAIKLEGRRRLGERKNEG